MGQEIDELDWSLDPWVKSWKIGGWRRVPWMSRAFLGRLHHHAPPPQRRCEKRTAALLTVTNVHARLLHGDSLTWKCNMATGKTILYGPGKVHFHGT